MTKIPSSNVSENSLIFQNIKENLVHYLPECQKHLVDNDSFHDLCVTYYYFIQAIEQKKDVKEMMQQLKHYISRFNNLCENHYSKEIKIQEKEELICKQKSRKLDDLYKAHIESHI